MWFDVPVGLSNPGAPRLALSRSSAMAWCLAILLLLALLAPGALQEAAWRPLTALLPQLATLALPFMATSLVSLRDTLSLSLVTVAVVVVVLGRRPRASYAPRCQKRVLFLFRFTQQRDIIMRPNFHPLKTRTLHSRKMDPDRSHSCFFFLISILMSCLAADLAKRFFENGPRNSIDDDDTRVADVDKERVRLGG